MLEVAFEGLQRSTRHKSGLAMRFPRINRLRWDKPPREADRLDTLERMLEKIETGRGAAQRRVAERDKGSDHEHAAERPTIDRSRPASTLSPASSAARRCR